VTRDRKLRKLRENQFKRLNEPIPPEKQDTTLLDRMPREFWNELQRKIEEAKRGK